MVEEFLVGVIKRALKEYEAEKLKPLTEVVQDVEQEAASTVLAAVAPDIAKESDPVQAIASPTVASTPAMPEPTVTELCATCGQPVGQPSQKDCASEVHKSLPD